MEKQDFIENLESVAGEVMDIDPKNLSTTDSIRRLQSSVIDLISVMIGAARGDEGAPAGAGAPAEPSVPASPSPG